MPSLASNVVANYVGRIWGALLSLIFVPFYLRFLGVEAYGLIGFYAALTSVLGILDLGIGATLTRELARLSATNAVSAQQDLVRTLETLYWTIAICAGLVTIALAPAISTHWLHAQGVPQNSLVTTVRLMAVGASLQFPLSFYQGGLMGLQRQVLVNALLAAMGTLRSVGAIFVLALFSSTIQAFVGWQVFTTLVGTVALMTALRKALGFDNRNARFQMAVIKRVRGYALSISANAVVGVLLAQLDKIILSRMLPLRLFGFYTIAGTMASVVWMIIVPFNTAIFPKLVQLFELNHVAELRGLFHRAAQTLAIFLLPVCAILVVFSRDLLWLWVHDETVVAHAFLIVKVLVVGTMINGLISIPAYSASAFGWPQLITYTNLAQAAIIVPTIVVLVSRYGPLGGAVGWTLMNIIYLTVMAPLFFRRFFKEERSKWYFEDVMLPAVVAFLVCLLVARFVPDTSDRAGAALRVLVASIAAVLSTAVVLPHVRGLAKAKILSVSNRFERRHRI